MRSAMASIVGNADRMAGSQCESCQRERRMITSFARRMYMRQLEKFLAVPPGRQRCTLKLNTRKTVVCFRRIDEGGLRDVGLGACS